MSNDAEKIIYSMMRVSKYYNKRPVLKDISLSYFYGAKIGVLGLNGSGKSSLLRILAGVDTEFEGKTTVSPGYTIGYLEQEPQLDPERTVREIVEEGVQETVDLVNEFNDINMKFAEPMSDDEMDALITRQGEVQEKLDTLDAWDLDSRLEMAMDACAAPKDPPKPESSPAAKSDAWPCAGCCCRNPTSCFWTNPQTTSTPNPWAGWNNTCSATREPSSRSPMTGTFWITWPDGFWNWTGARASPGRVTTPRGLSRSR